MASVQSNYVAWPASIPASHAVLRWRPCIQPASEIRLALFIFKPDTNLGLFTSASTEPLPATLRSTRRPSFKPLNKVLPRALKRKKKQNRKIKSSLSFAKGPNMAEEINSYWHNSVAAREEVYVCVWRNTVMFLHMSQHAYITWQWRPELN